MILVWLKSGYNKAEHLCSHHTINVYELGLERVWSGKPIVFTTGLLLWAATATCGAAF